MKAILLKIITEIWPMMVVFMVVYTLLRFFYLKNHRNSFSFYKEFLTLISIMYIWLLFEILTMTELNTASGINLVPFSEIMRYKIGTKMFNYSVIGNIVIFIPFGYLVDSYVKPKNIMPVLLMTLITSITIEIVQLNIGRSFDIDDIILNVLGGLLGYLIHVGLKAIQRKLPDMFSRDWFYNLICIIIIALILIYVFGLWSVIFK